MLEAGSLEGVASGSVDGVGEALSAVTVGGGVGVKVGFAVGKSVGVLVGVEVVVEVGRGVGEVVTVDAGPAEPGLGVEDGT